MALLMLTGVFLMSFLPKHTIAQIRPMCLSQFALANQACGVLPTTEGPRDLNATQLQVAVDNDDDDDSGDDDGGGDEDVNEREHRHGRPGNGNGHSHRPGNGSDHNQRRGNGNGHGRAAVMEMEMAAGRGMNMTTTTVRGMSTAMGMEVITGMNHERTRTAADGWRRWMWHACVVFCTVFPHFSSSLITDTALRLETLACALSTALGSRNNPKL